MLKKAIQVIFCSRFSNHCFKFRIFIKFDFWNLNYSLYLILTLNENSNSSTINSRTFQLPIELSQSLKWINLNRNHATFLSSFLHRSLIKFQVEKSSMKETCIIMERAVHFVIEVYGLINEFINKCGFVQNSLSKFIVLYQ